MLFRWQAASLGKPKGDKRDRTRALLEAARALIREKGYERTTLEEVASRAGMTTARSTGTSRIATSCSSRSVRRLGAGEAAIKPGATFAEAMRPAKATLAASTNAPCRRRTTHGLAYTLKNSELRARVHDITKSSYEFGAEWLDLFERSELPMPPKQLVRVIHALIEGLVMQRILTPDLCPDEVFYAAFGALAKVNSR